ncbi:MAG: HEAT repeat domain-containing protein, partial [Planctomycetia bacterium]|nr:HEAT repeat domain-containing protein [Planctomycetia bacterium]
MLNWLARTGLAAVLAAMLCATGAVAQKITIVKMTPVEELIKKLKSDDEYARDEAMYALVQTGKKAVPALMKLVNDATALQATPPPGYDFHLGKGMQGDPKWHGGGKQFYPSGLTVNRLAIRALGLIGDPAAVDVLVDQVKRSRMGLRMGDRGIRVECQRAIVGILGAKSPHVGGMRPWHLGEKGTAESAKGLANAVAGSMQAHNKGNIVEAFGPYVSIKSVDDLRRIDALAVIGSKEGSAPLLRLVKEGSRNDFQWFHCGMHNSMDLWHTLGISASAGMDDHWIAVVEAERALGHMGEKAAIPLLKNRLDDKNVMIRVSAARALAQLGDAAALPALLKDARWMNRAFIKGGYEKKVKDWAEGAWLRLW